MVGLRQVATRSPPIAVKSLENMSMKVFGCISLMSAPAAKAFSPPASRMQPIASSASRSSTAAAISRNTPNDSALSILGRLSVMTPTAALLSTMMCSNVLMIHPPPNLPAGGIGIKGGGALLRAPRFACAPRGRGSCVPSGHEHARGRGRRQKSAEGDEDFSDQRGLVPTGAVVAAERNRRSLRRRLGRRVGRRRVRRRRLALLQCPIDVVELIGGDDLGLGGRRGHSGIVGRRLQDFAGTQRH